MLGGLASVLKVVSVMSVNGLFIPIAEEFLWRGMVQPRLAHVVTTPITIGVTALLFSLKHVIVDASLGRLLTIVAFGYWYSCLSQELAYLGRTTHVH